jgi:hypothetical protein
MFRYGDSIQASQGIKHDLHKPGSISARKTKHKHLALVEPSLGWPGLLLLAKLGGEENLTHPIGLV